MIELAALILGLNLMAPADNTKLTDGVVVQVHSGDRFTLRKSGKLYKIRLANIFAPLLSQPFGKESKAYLEKMALQRRVFLDVKKIDAAGRHIADVNLMGQLWLNDEMIAAGLAWHYRVADPPVEHLAKLEYLAFSSELGLWLDPDPVPPWAAMRERIPPEPPNNNNQVDYDLIFLYGIVGDRQNRTYKWPACNRYTLPRKPVVFWSILEAEAQGFKTSRDCRY
ncbi:MAG: thermonuclease family protein [Nitrospina sp.]|nr:thermonuclease family protein [Nitrospina sp.]